MESGAPYQAGPLPLGYTSIALTIMGQGNGPQRSKQVRVDEVSSVFSALRSGDVLALFQYKWRRVDWVNHLKEMFRGAVAGAVVEHVADTDLALYSARKV